MLSEYELKYGKGFKNEKDVVFYCFNKVDSILSVLDIKGLDFVREYLINKVNELSKDSDK